jgi:IS5 family transposase
MPDGASRLVSLHDPDARPIRKGRIGHPVEFGYKAQVVDNPDGIVLDHQVMVGNPSDAPLLAPAIGRVIARTGRESGAVAADRGYGEARVDQELADLDVARVAIPRRGRASPARQLIERQRGFRRLVKWRTGCEAASAASSTTSAGTAPSWTTSRAPASGAATARSPTTWSRSAGCWRPSTARQHEHSEHQVKRRPPQGEADHPTIKGFFRGKEFETKGQSEVARDSSQQVGRMAAGVEDTHPPTRHPRSRKAHFDARLARSAT